MESESQFEILPDKLSWHDGKQACEDLGMEMVNLESQESETHLNEYLANQSTL